MQAKPRTQPGWVGTGEKRSRGAAAAVWVLVLSAARGSVHSDGQEFEYCAFASLGRRPPPCGWRTRAGVEDLGLGVLEQADKRR